MRNTPPLRSSANGGLLAALAAFLFTASQVTATEYEVEVVIDGLSSPKGIVAAGKRTLFYTEVPTPGVPGPQGGTNTVKKINLRSGSTQLISEGEPYPINLAIGPDRDVYWTCQTAGVILQYNRKDGRQFFIPADPENGEFLFSPTGIAVAPGGEVLFTELPNPGTPGENMVSVTDGTNITLISSDEPAPTDIVVAPDGTAYWTCQTAGVIIRRSPAGVISILIDGLNSPVGIALDRRGRTLYFTEVPTPGVTGDNGGLNTVNAYDLKTKERTVISDFFPYPADITVARNGTVYWTCTTAGVIAKAVRADD